MIFDHTSDRAKADVQFYEVIQSVQLADWLEIRAYLLLVAIVTGDSDRARAMAADAFDLAREMERRVMQKEAVANAQSLTD